MKFNQGEWTISQISIHINLKVFSYNIHKGFTTVSGRYIVDDMKRALHEVHPDIVFLQEMHGRHPDQYLKQALEQYNSPLEHFADTLWPHHAYGKNAVYASGHHGNAILSKYPFSRWENINVSTNRFERRGLLHGVVNVPGCSESLHLLCLHLNLMEGGRRQQVDRIVERIKNHVEPTAPLILAGDFNDWRQRISKTLFQELQLQEACLMANGQHSKTFPSWRPFLPLDRIYFRGFQVHQAEALGQSPWDQLSDHRPILAQLSLEKTPQSQSTCEKDKKAQ